MAKRAITLKGKPVDKQYTKPEKFDFKLTEGDKEWVEAG